MSMQKLLKSELIGRYIVVLDSKNRTLKGQKGPIIDETKNFFLIENEKGARKKIIKSQCVFGFRNDDFHDNENRKDNKDGEKDSNSKDSAEGFIKIDGALLTARPEDRIKTKVKNGRRN